jgi:hypothetical protein
MKQFAIGRELLLFQVSDLFGTRTVIHYPRHQPSFPHDPLGLEAEEAIHWSTYEVEHAEIQNSKRDSKTNLTVVSPNLEICRRCDS